MTKEEKMNEKSVLDAMYKYGITLRPVLQSEGSKKPYWLAKITGNNTGSLMRWDCSKKKTKFHKYFQRFQRKFSTKSSN